MVDQLAAEYAGRPVVFLEYNYYTSPRADRFWAAHGGTVAYFPCAIADSGHQVVDGYVDYHLVYGQMVDAELPRQAKTALHASQQRVGNRVRFTVQMLNQSGVTLSYATNSATVWGIVYEDAHVGVTNRYVRAAVATLITSPLASGATASFALETNDLSGVDWNKVHYLAFAEYRPGGAAGPYDMLQAAWAVPGSYPGIQ